MNNPFPLIFRSNTAISILYITMFAAVSALIQWYMPYPIDDDTAYHFSVARLINEYGSIHSFPWTRFSTQFDSYADKEFLFHLIFIPFIGLGFIDASRAVGALCGTILLTSILFVLQSEKIRYSAIWALVPLGASIFVYRFAQVRPQLLSITLATLLLWAIARNRLKILFCVSLLYPLSYVAFWQIPLILLIATGASVILSGRKLQWKSAAILSAGIVLGILLHPNSWNLISINWIHMTDVLLRNAWGNRVEFNMGDEFDPFTVTELIQYLAIPLFMAVLGGYLGFKARKENQLPLAFGLSALIFGLLALRTNRFLEYFVPFSAIALALGSATLSRRYLGPVLLCISVAYTLLVGTVPYENLASMESRNWFMEPEVKKQIERYVPEGANVFTTGWEYTGTLLLNLPKRNYMVALDPTLMYRRNPALYNDWYRLLLDSPGNSVKIIRTRFDSRFAICRNHPELWPFFDRVSATPGVRTLYADNNWILFDLGEDNSR